MPSSEQQVRISIANPEKVSVNVTTSSNPPGGSPNLAAGDGLGGSENVWLGSRRDPVSRSVSNKSQPPASSDKGAGQSESQKHKERKLGHRRIRKDGEVTYKKFETTQLIGSIQLGIQHSVGGLANVPDRDLLMQDFMSIDTVYFTRDGLLQKTPAHNYSEFRFRTYASFAFRRFRKLFNIETDLYLASICSEPMIELSNPGVSGSIFYVTNDDNFICKTVLHKEAEFLQKISLGYYLNLEQNQRTLLPKFFGLYCYSCNAKNVRLVVMNNLFPSELKMHHKFDLKGSTYKRKANRHERAKKSPTYKDLDFMEMYPEGIILQNDIYHSLMNSIQRDCIVLESFKIMDYSLLIGIHNLDQAAKERDEGARVDVDVSDGESGSHTTDKNFDRQGSVIHRERMIAHSTALESITMEVGVDHNHDVSHDASGVVGGSDFRKAGDSYDGVDGGGINNVWGGIPAKNHRGENLLLFIGIIDILQSYGMLKKVEHYWKSLIHDGDTVSVHRPGFYARRFQSFMKDKVFKKQISNVKPTLSFKRDRDKKQHPEPGSSDLSTSGPPVRGTKDNAVTVIAIDSTGASTNLTDEVFLPPVLQDRKPRTISASGKNSTSSTSGDGAGDSTQQPQDLATTEVEAVTKPEPVFPSPEFKTPKTNGVGNALLRDNADTGSIITMTSDERVQIFVPSPSGGGTPYSTITKTSNFEFQRTAATGMPSPRLPSTSISWNEISPVKSSGGKMNLPRKSSSGGLDPEELDIPPFARRVTASPVEAYRSLTPLNMDCSDSSTPSKHSSNSPRLVKATAVASSTITEGVAVADELNMEPLSLSDIQLIDKENTQS